MGPLIVSPHFDDAALSFGQTVQSFRGVSAVTVFAGVPRDSTVLTTYDEHCGFTSAAQAVVYRQAEDDRAMAVLGIRNLVRLPFVDNQYKESRDRDAVVGALREVINLRDPSGVFAPIGALHPDHVFLTEVVLDLTVELGMPVWLWADLPNTVTEPRSLVDALARVALRGFTPSETKLPAGPMERKRGAVRCYRSQLWALRNNHIYIPERLWRIN